MKTTDTREYFGSTGSADRVRTHRSGEAGPRFDQLIEVRRFNDRIAQGGDRIGTLIVAEQEDDVRLSGSGVCILVSSGAETTETKA